MVRVNDRQSLGRYGERLAAKFLRHRGYRIIDRNWRCDRGEVDLIAWAADARLYVFSEVKTRKNLNYGHPLEAISAQKLGAMFTVANTWKKQHFTTHVHYCIDAISVYWLSGFPNPAHARIEHIKEIFKCH